MRNIDSTILAFLMLVLLVCVLCLFIKVNNMDIDAARLQSQMNAELDRAKRTYDEATIEKARKLTWRIDFRFGQN